MQQASAGAADVEVDRVLDQGVGQRVLQVAAAFVLDERSRRHELLDVTGHVLRGASGQRLQLAETHGTPDDRHDLHDPLLRLGKAAHPRADALDEAFRQPTQLRRVQVGALVQQRAQQALGVQRVALRTLVQPLHELRGRRSAEHGGGQIGDAGHQERPEVQPTQQPVLLQLEQHMRGHLVANQLGRPRCPHEQDRPGGEPPGHSAKRLP